jgi:Serine dehydrogenase proteinase
MSAATMVACAANQIVMGKHSFLGPIDPQLILQTALGNRLVPVQNILEQFERALRDGADPVKLRVWAPMLTQYGPDLLVTCQNLASLSEELVSEWLKSYMFKGQADAEAKGKAIARWLSGHSTFKTHARPLSRDELRAQGLTGIRALGQNQAEQDLFLSIHHATAHTFTSTAGVKIIENNLGKADMRMLNVVQPISRKSPRSLESRRRR